MPGDVRGRVVAAAALALTLLVGCGVDDRAVEQIESVSGVERVWSSCTKGHCTVSVEATPTIAPADLREVIEVLRATRGDELGVRLRTAGSGASTPEVSIRVDARSGEQLDADVVDLALAEATAQDVEFLSILTYASVQLVGARVEPGVDDLWPVVTRLQASAASLPAPALDVTHRDESTGRLNGVVLSGPVPPGAQDLVRALDAEQPRDSLGALVLDDQVVVGAVDRAAAARVETWIDALEPGTPEVRVEVVESMGALFLRATRDR